MKNMLFAKILLTAASLFAAQAQAFDSGNCTAMQDLYFPEVNGELIASRMVEESCFAVQQSTKDGTVVTESKLIPYKSGRQLYKVSDGCMLREIVIKKHLIEKEVPFSEQPVEFEVPAASYTDTEISCEEGRKRLPQ